LSCIPAEVARPKLLEIILKFWRLFINKSIRANKERSIISIPLGEKLIIAINEKIINIKDKIKPL
tara:strand:+ start:236 stop:430 length:195 start_codon:yes stop_codon:yes gene_type:complete